METSELYLSPVVKGRNTINGQFVKGHKPYNKGLSMKLHEPEKYKKCRKTMFKKGHVIFRKYAPGGQRWCRPVEMFTKSGKFCGAFPSITNASRMTGIERKNIEATINGKRKSAGGYIFIEVK